MSGILQSTLRSKLEQVTNNWSTGSTQVTDVLSMALSVWTQNEPNILTVASVADLPILEVRDSPDAILCFITALGIFVISSQTRWITLDGRLVRSDQDIFGVAWAWGSNANGRLGDGTGTNRLSPVSVTGGILDWCEISAGSAHSVAVRSSGSAWAWGCNSSGPLGDGTVTCRLSPVSVVGGFSDWCQISAGCFHSVAVRSSGRAWAWGSNTRGQLGDLTVTARSSPVSVVGGFSDWCEISAGGEHSVAVRSSGSAWAWGNNICGRLGDNTTTNRSSPVSVVGGFSDWCQISAGGVHTLAVRSSGHAWAWGYNGAGRLGDNTIVAKSSPVSVIGGITDWCEISAGSEHSVAVRSSGSAWAWGSNGGRLGDGTTTSRRSPVSVIGGISDWCQASTGGQHSVAVRSSGSAWAWGNNASGQLGDTTFTNRSSPVSVVGGISDWCQVSAGACHNLGIRTL
jgi:alpha-tubulin suppressor-like RCC1 family protein